MTAFTGIAYGTLFSDRDHVRTLCVGSKLFLGLSVVVRFAKETGRTTGASVIEHLPVVVWRRDLAVF